MDLEMGQFQQAELHDALGACDELYNVISRLKRLGLLSEEEDRQTKDSIERVTQTLFEKLPEGAEED
jgi:hypothetical protein